MEILGLSKQFMVQWFLVLSNQIDIAVRILANQDVSHCEVVCCTIYQDLRKARYYKVNADTGYTFQNVAIPISELGFSDSVHQTCEVFLSSQGVTLPFLNDFIGGITRNTYLQDTDRIHSFGCLIATFSGLDDTHSIQGGNNQIFEKFLEGTDVYLGSEITSIEKLFDGRYRLATDAGEV
jgi:Prenylcysteine lyase